MLLHRWRKKVSSSHEHKLSQRSATLMLSIQQPMKDYQQRQWIQKMEHRCAYKLQVCWNEGRESWRDPAPANRGVVNTSTQRKVSRTRMMVTCLSAAGAGTFTWRYSALLYPYCQTFPARLHNMFRCVKHLTCHQLVISSQFSSSLPEYAAADLTHTMVCWSCMHSQQTHRTRSSLQTNCDFHRSPITKHTGVQVRKVIPTKRLQVSLSLPMWVLRFSSRTTELPDGTHSSPPYQAEGIQGYHPSLLSLMDGICRLEESRPCPENWCWGPACTGALGYLASISPPQALGLFLHHGGDT